LAHGHVSVKDEREEGGLRINAAAPSDF